ncbi:MAG: cache domain-containing protein [Polyangiaceae bacterium]
MRKLDIAIVVSWIVFCIGLGAYIYGYVHRTSGVQSQLVRVTEGAARDIRSQLAHVEEITQTLANEVANGDLDEERLNAELERAVRSDPLIVEAGVAFVRDKGPSGTGLFAPHFGIRGGKSEAFHVETAYDYTASDWFKDTLANGPGWTDPYFGKATGSWVVGYGIPIRAPGAAANASPIAVVRVNYSMKQIRSKIESLPLGSEGYACIARTKTTRVIYHPNESFIKDRVTLFDIATKRTDSVLRRLALDVEHGRSGIVERPATLTGELAWNIYRPIAGTNWNLILVFIKNEALGDGKNERIGCIAITSVLVVALSLLILRLFRVDLETPWRLWLAVASVTTLLGGAVGYIWHLSFDPRVFNDVQRGMLYDNNGLQRFSRSREQFSRQRGEPTPLFVPTGVALSSIEFKTAADVTMKGYIWQKIPVDQRDRVLPGFELADAIESQITEAYRHTVQDVEVRGYAFRATLRQQFDYRRYPLDFQRIRLVLSRKDFANNVIFVPDLAAYTSMIPQTKPGLDRSLAIAGWQLEKTFFNFAQVSYNANFGIDHFVGAESHPALAFNAVVRRDFRSPFIANIVPLLLIAGIGFALLSMIHREQDRITAYDARGGRVTGTSAALFFALLLAHIRLRNELVGLRETIYIEYFYFVMYASCLAIVADALAVASRTPPAWLQFRDNFIPKLLYWPTLMVLILAITIGFFC